MIDPETVLLAMPAHDGRVMIETCASLILNKGKYAGMVFPAEVTGPSLVRSIIAHHFLRIPEEKAQWLVCLDNDVVVSPRDWDLMMEPTAEPVTDSDIEKVPTPTRVLTQMIEWPEPGAEPIRSAGSADALVCCEYPYKNESGNAIKLGLGFTRIHRSVFAALDSLTHEDGTGKILKMIFQGTLISNYFPEGAALTGIIPNAIWKGEDHGFFTLCMLAGIVPRIEKRTRLKHIGRKAYEYVPESERVIGQ